MSDLVLYPVDVVAELRAWLLTNLDVPVLGAMTADEGGVDAETRRHPEFVRLTRTGGTDPHRRSQEALVAIETWALTPEGAHDLAQDALRLAKLLPFEHGAVNRVRTVSGPGEFPDPLSKHDRFKQLIAARASGTTTAPVTSS